MDTKTKSREQIIMAAYSLMLQKGLKSLTMDLVAAELSMSKRTLYELFGSKHNLIVEVIRHSFKKHRERAAEIFKNAPNTMVALADIFALQTRSMCGLSLKFFSDIDRLYPEIGTLYRSNRDEERRDWMFIHAKGVEEGVFRPNVNMELLGRMMYVQMEALKRLDPSQLGNFTLAEIYEAISTSFLRSLASVKGMEILDNHLQRD